MDWHARRLARQARAHARRTTPPHGVSFTPDLNGQYLLCFGQKLVVRDLSNEYLEVYFPPTAFEQRLRTNPLFQVQFGGVGLKEGPRAVSSAAGSCLSHQVLCIGEGEQTVRRFPKPPPKKGRTKKGRGKAEEEEEEGEVLELRIVKGPTVVIAGRRILVCTFPPDGKDGISVRTLSNVGRNISQRCEFFPVCRFPGGNGRQGDLDHFATGCDDHTIRVWDGTSLIARVDIGTEAGRQCRRMKFYEPANTLILAMSPRLGRVKDAEKHEVVLLDCERCSPVGAIATHSSIGGLVTDDDHMMGRALVHSYETGTQIMFVLLSFSHSPKSIRSFDMRTAHFVSSVQVEPQRPYMPHDHGSSLIQCDSNLLFIGMTEGRILCRDARKMDPKPIASKQFHSKTGAVTEIIHLGGDTCCSSTTWTNSPSINTWSTALKRGVNCSEDNSARLCTLQRTRMVTPKVVLLKWNNDGFGERCSFMLQLRPACLAIPLEGVGWELHSPCFM